MHRIHLVLVLGLSLTCFAWAHASDTTNAPPHDGPPHGGHGPMFTPEEQQELMAAHDAAMKADPSLEAEQKDLNEKQQALRKKIDEAMIKADPKVAPLLAKFKDAHPHREGAGHDGPPPDDKGKPAGN